MSSTTPAEETLSAEEVLSNVDIDVEVTSSTMILGAQNSVDEGHAEDASMLEGTTPVELRQTNVTTVPKGHSPLLFKSHLTSVS
jgi:hypothetical protein